MRGPTAPLRPKSSRAPDARRIRGHPHRAVGVGDLDQLGAGQRTARSTSGARNVPANGSAYRSRTIGVDARFSATAIIRWPRTSRNSSVDWVTDTAATAPSTMATTTQLEDQELAGQAARDAHRRASRGATSGERNDHNFLCVRKSDLCHFGVQYC